MYSAYKLNKQGDNIEPWHTPFPIWNQSVVPCPVLTVASWPAYRFLKRQVRWSGIPISFRILRYMYTMKHYSTLKGTNLSQCHEVDEPRACFTEWSKSEREKQISYINAYIWNPERRCWWTKLLFHASVLGVCCWVASDPHFSLPWNSSIAGLHPPVSSLFVEMQACD